MSEPTYGQVIVREGEQYGLPIVQGGGGSGGPVAWADITGKPSTFAPSGHHASHEDAGGADVVDWWLTELPDATLLPFGAFGNGLKLVDGVVTVINPFSTPAAPTAAESAAAGVVTAGDHLIVLRYNTAAGSVLSAATTVTSDGAHKIDVTIPAYPVGVLSIDVIASHADQTVLYEGALDVPPSGVYQFNVADFFLVNPASGVNTAGGNLTVDGKLTVTAGGLVARYGDLDTQQGGSIDLGFNELALYYQDAGANISTLLEMDPRTIVLRSFGSGTDAIIELVSDLVNPSYVRITGSSVIFQGGAVSFAPSTTSYPSMNIPAGVAPSAPTDEDMWTDGDNLCIRINGVTYNVMLEAA